MDNSRIEIAIKEVTVIAINRAMTDKVLPDINIPEFQVNLSKNPEYGDFACNVAFKLSKFMKLSPIEIATKLKPYYEKVIDNARVC